MYLRNGLDDPAHLLVDIGEEAVEERIHHILLVLPPEKGAESAAATNRHRQREKFPLLLPGLAKSRFFSKQKNPAQWVFFINLPRRESL